MKLYILIANNFLNRYLGTDVYVSTEIIIVYRILIKKTIKCSTCPTLTALHAPRSRDTFNLHGCSLMPHLLFRLMMSFMRFANMSLQSGATSRMQLSKTKVQIE